MQHFTYSLGPLFGYSLPLSSPLQTALLIPSPPLTEIKNPAQSGRQRRGGEWGIGNENSRSRAGGGGEGLQMQGCWEEAMVCKAD